MIDDQLARTIAGMAAELTKLQGDVRILKQSQTTSQLSRSSIDDGMLTVVSAGQVRSVIGLQPDGTVTHVDVNGPAPPVPSAPTLTAAPSGLTAAWDGTFAGGAAQPLDFADVEVHMSTTPSFTPSVFTMRGVLTKAGQVTVQPLNGGTTYYFGLVGVNTSGIKSVISAEVSGVPATALLSPITASEIGNIGVLNANPYFTGGDITGWTSGGGTPGSAIIVASPSDPAPDTPVQQQVSDITGSPTASLVVGSPLQPPPASPIIGPTVIPLAGAGIPGIPGTVSVVSNQPAGSPYAYALKLVSNTTGGGTAYEPGPPAFPVVQNQQYLVTGLFYTPGTSVSLGLSFLLNGVWITDVVQTSPVSPNTWTQVTSVITAPTGVNAAGPVFFTSGLGSQYTMYGQGIIALPQVPGALIQAGTVTATQIAAGTVVAGIINGTVVEAATLIVDSSGPGTGAFVYTGSMAGPGNMIGSWAAAAGTDIFGNSYPAGLAATQGQLTGVGISTANILQSILNYCTENNPTINNPSIVGGTELETQIIFDTVGGSLLVYVKTLATVTLTGEGSWTAPAGSTGTAKVECWGAGGGGGNFAGTSSSGGGGGGGGEYACEPTYPITAGQTYSYNTGTGGRAASNGPGGTGHDTWFDSRNVYANGGPGGGTSGTLWVGGQGGTGSTNTIHYNGAQGGNGFGPGGGGGGGGSSAGTAAAGAAGTDGSHSGGLGGAGGTAPSGGGNGGAGGNNGATGSNGSAPGGGGGGAGFSSGSGTHIDTFTPTATYSYYGPDNTLGNALTLSNTNGNMQQGLGNVLALGTYFSFAHYNSSAIVSTLSGRTIDTVTVAMDCLHAWYSSGMTIYLDYTNISTFPSTITIPSSTHIGSFGIGEGESTGISLPASVGTAFQSGAAHTLYFNAPSGDHSYYGYFQGGIGANSPKLTINSHTGSPVLSGSGADGQLKVTYTNSVTLAASFSGTAFTDAYGNSVPVGVMVSNLQSVHPGSNPQIPETWQTPALGSGWATGTHSLGVTIQNVRYRKLANNSVEVNGMIHTTSTSPAATMWTMPAGYIPTTWQRFGCITTGLGGVTAENGVDFHPDGTVQMQAAITANNVDVPFNMIYPLD